MSRQFRNIRSEIFKTGMSPLNYGDVQVSFEDFQLLFGPKWINDTLISFVFEYYRKDIYKKQQAKIAFVPPEVTQIIKMMPSDEDLLSVTNSLDLQSKDLVFLPINDNDMDQVGGTHWSLLVYFKMPGPATSGSNQSDITMPASQNTRLANKRNRRNSSNESSKNNSSNSSTIDNSPQLSSELTNINENSCHPSETIIPGSSSSSLHSSSDNGDSSIGNQRLQPMNRSDAAPTNRPSSSNLHSTTTSHSSRSSSSDSETNSNINTPADSRCGHYVHFDSLELNSRNIESARIVAQRLSHCTALPGKPITIHRDTSKRDLRLRGNGRKATNNLVREDDNFPKQTNTYDCGLYVILAVTILAENYRNPNCGFTTSEINPTAINSLRQQLRQTIEVLYKEHLIDNQTNYIHNGNNCIAGNNNEQIF